MTTEEVRQTFLEYFLEHDHQLVRSAGIVPQNDSTLMFINSGMAPLKPYFTGQAKPPYPRLTNVQNCIRFVDIDDVGDATHGTSFRMMGSWSFGDYFKERAIELAFELITEKFGIPADRLLATVFVADDILPGVPSDDVSARAWEHLLPRDRIIACGPADNFWGPAGTSGPCGPCTEIFFDRGPEFATGETSGALVPGQHIEIWNAGVFMQYFMDESGMISPLAMKCVDTGAGLERFAMILQGKASIHEIDQYEEMYDFIHACVLDTRWTRIILDHLKTAIIMIREGVIPSNTREGYLLRRVIRRAMIGMHLSGLGLSLIQEWVNLLSEEIDNKKLTRFQKSFIDQTLAEERVSFDRLMSRSKKHLDKIVTDDALDAKQAFQLKAGMGIHEDILEGICVRHGIPFPKTEFLKLMEEHRGISRSPNK